MAEPKRLSDEAERFIRACQKQVAVLAKTPMLYGDMAVQKVQAERYESDAAAVLAAAMAVTAAAEVAIHTILRKDGKT